MKTLESANLPAGLYLVATPIGNMRDITLRALDVLKAVDLIICEDTRVSGKLLKTHGIDAKTIAYNDHNAAKQRPAVIDHLSRGSALALISDAGTPLISDPGYKLVRDCIDLGIHVTSIPGASAPITALQLSGMATDKFSFLGFLPPKKAARQKTLETWQNSPGTLVVFESGPRLADSLADMARILGDRQAAVLREMTKMYEEKRHDTLTRLAEYYRDEKAPKGEIVLVIAPPETKAWTESALRAALREKLKTMRVKDAAADIAAASGASKKTLYDMALSIDKEKDEKQP